ncbi:hypothetical protein [Sphingomonas sp. PAMC 26617]|uniref:hypothetical protein n=1 Tax=Sphingomonas sp. PAMC 26617 TaxID=1112216 RepID=UPI0012F47C3B|nr:hypothetical protein [Sphingomonas sp. PAMC 26617]
MSSGEQRGVSRRGLLGGAAAASVGVASVDVSNVTSTAPNSAHISLNPALSIERFGARPDASPEINLKAFLRCLAQCRQDGTPLLIPAERYELQSPHAPIDLTRIARNARRAIAIIGTGGPGSSVLSLKAGGLQFASLTDWFDPTFEGFSVIGNTNRALFEIGNSDFSDPVNMMRIRDVYVENSSAQQSATGVVLNYIAPGSYAIGLKSNVYSDGKTAFAGTALRCRQVEAMSFVGGAAGNAAVGVHIVDGFNFGLSFTGMTFENCAVAVQHVSDKSGGHVFQGCQFSNLRDWSIESFAANESAWIELIACNFTMAEPLVNPVRYHGVRIRDRRNIETPVVPKSGTAVNNATGRDVDIYIWGGNITEMEILGAWMPYGNADVRMVRLAPGRQISLRWKAMPSWKWHNGG